MTNAVQPTSFGFLEHSPQPSTSVGCAELSALSDSVIEDHRGSVYNFPDDFVPQVGLQVLQFDSPANAEAWAANVAECEGLLFLDEGPVGDAGLVSMHQLGRFDDRLAQTLLVADNFFVSTQTLGTSRERAAAATDEMVTSLVQQLELAVADSDLPSVELQPVFDDRALLAERIRSFPDILGPQFIPQIGTGTDAWLLEKSSFVHHDACGDQPAGFNAGLLHLSGIAEVLENGGNGGFDVWVYTFDEPAQAVAYGEAMRDLWNDCLESYKAERGLDVPRIEPDDDLLGDGSGIAGAWVDFGEVDDPSPQFDLVRGRVWGRIRMGAIDAALDPAVKADLLRDFEQLLTMD